MGTKLLGFSIGRGSGVKSKHYACGWGGCRLVGADTAVLIFCWGCGMKPSYLGEDEGDTSADGFGPVEYGLFRQEQNLAPCFVGH